MKSVRYWEPIFIENSKVPAILSKFAPISIGAITLGFIVFSKGTISERTRQHETIHFQQYLETAYIGFLLLYAYDYIKNYIRFTLQNFRVQKNSPGWIRSVGYTSYMNIRAEKEAYQHDTTPDYLESRERW